MSDQTYTQAELEAAKKEAAAAAVAREKAQREKFIPRDEHEKTLQEAKNKAIEAFKAEQEQFSSAKEKFIAAGGNKDAFDDFYNSSKDKLKFDNDSTLEKSISEIKETKGYMFSETQQQGNDDQQGTKSSDYEDDEYFEGSLQKKPK